MFWPNGDGLQAAAAEAADFDPPRRREVAITLALPTHERKGYEASRNATTGVVK
jgi:hypothetical protein